MKLHLLMAFFLLSTAGCRTGGNGSSVKDDTPPTQGQPAVNGFPTSTSFKVTTPGFAYTITDASGRKLTGDNPDLTLTHGNTYTFHVNAKPSHPFIITNDADATDPFLGAANNNVATGDVVLTLPATGSPTTLFYRCSVHIFGGTITVN